MLSLAGALVAIGHAQSGPTDLQRARELVRSGRAAEAVGIYEQAVQSDPKNPRLHLQLCIAQFTAKQYEQSISSCATVLSLDGELRAAWMFIGASHFQSRRYEQAIAALERALTSHEDRNARLMLAESNLFLRRWDPAIDHFTKASAALADEPRVWYGLERAHTEAARELEQAVETTARGKAEWHALMGDAGLRVRRYGLALAQYREALRLDPSLTGARAGMAAVYQKTGHPEWARQVDLDRDPPPTRYETIRRHRHAAEDAFARLQTLGESPQLSEVTARRLHEQGRFTEAVHEWKRAVGSSAPSAPLRMGLVLSLLEARQHGEAETHIRALLSGDAADWAEVRLLAGRLYLDMERPADAVPHLQRAGKGGAPLLGEALLKAGRPAEAIPYLSAAAKEDSDGIKHFQLARALQALGRSHEAQEALEGYRERQKQAARARTELEADYPITAP